ncbi:MAG: guanylate kinase [Planctomycetota bacterium]
MSKTTIKKQIVVISGPSGVGKTTLCNHLIRKEPRLKPCVTATTRVPRQGEIDGRDYFFISKSDFRSGIKNKKFVEYTKLFGNYYGTPIDSLNSIFNEGKYPLLRVDVKGAGNLKRQGFKGVYIFILPPDIKTLKQRLVKRQGKESRSELNQRLKRARREMKYYQNYDYQVINDKIPGVVKEIHNIIKKHLYFR